MLTYQYTDIIVTSRFPWVLIVVLVVGVVAAVAVVDITVTASSGQVLWHQGCPYQQASARPTGTWFVVLFVVCVFLCCSFCVLSFCFVFVFVVGCPYFLWFVICCSVVVVLLCVCLFDYVKHEK